MKIKYMMLTLTDKCNLQCIYCYEKNKTDAVMDKDFAIQAIEAELNGNDEYEAVEVAFHGGEPFLCFGMIKEICERIWAGTYKKKYYFFITTNGTLVAGEVQEWLFRNKDKIMCCLSIDGNSHMQDINRCGSFDRLDLEFFRRTWPQQEVKMTVSNETLPELYDGIVFLHECGFEIAENFGYGIDWNQADNVSILTRELSKLIRYYLDHPELKRCRLLSAPIEYLAYDHLDNIHCSIGDMVVYSVDGRKYPCHFFLPNSVGDEMAEKSFRIDFTDKSIYQDPSCRNCKALNVCPTCYGANYAATGSPAIRDKTLCEMIKVSAKATAYLLYQIIDIHGISFLNLSPEKEKATLIGIQKANEI